MKNNIYVYNSVNRFIYKMFSKNFKLKVLLSLLYIKYIYLINFLFSNQILININIYYKIYFISNNIFHYSNNIVN